MTMQACLSSSSFSTQQNLFKHKGNDAFIPSHIQGKKALQALKQVNVAATKRAVVPSDRGKWTRRESVELAIELVKQTDDNQEVGSILHTDFGHLTNSELATIALKQKDPVKAWEVFGWLELNGRLTGAESADFYAGIVRLMSRKRQWDMVDRILTVMETHAALDRAEEQQWRFKAYEVGIRAAMAAKNPEVAVNLLERMAAAGLGFQKEMLVDLMKGLYGLNNPIALLPLAEKLMVHMKTNDMREVGSYEYLLRMYVKAGQAAKVLSLITEMKAVNLPSSTQTFHTVLRVFGWKQSADHSREFLQWMAEQPGSSVEANGIVDPTKFFRVCVTTKNPNSAFRFIDLQGPTQQAFEALLQECVHQHSFQFGFKVLEAMEDRGFSPTMFTYRLLIDLCAKCRASDEALKVYEHIIKSRLQPNVYVYNSLMNVLASDWDAVQEIFHQMQACGVRPDCTSLNVILKAGALEVKNARSAPPTSSSDQKLKGIHHSRTLYRSVQQWAGQHGIQMDVITYTSAIQMLGLAGDWEGAVEVQRDMQTAGVQGNVMTWTALIGACGRAGMVEQALRLLESMKQSGVTPTTVTFNCVMDACAEAGQEKRVQALLCQMREANCLPNTRTFNSVMKACGSSAERVQAVMEEMQAQGVVPDMRSWTTLLNAYASSRDLASARQVFESMQKVGIQPDVISYTALIKACMFVGEEGEAHSIYQEMKQKGVRVNQVTYNTLLRYGPQSSPLSVQRALSTYQDMRQAGYAPNDTLLKRIIGQWAEHTLGLQSLSGARPQGVTGGETQGSSGWSSGEYLWSSQGAVSGKGDEVEQCFTLDLHTLSLVEARTAVLCLLRVLKEKFNAGAAINDTLVIVFGESNGRSDYNASQVERDVLHLLTKELGISVKRQQDEGEGSGEASMETIGERQSGLDSMLSLLPRKSSEASGGTEKASGIYISKEAQIAWLQRTRTTKGSISPST